MAGTASMESLMVSDSSAVRFPMRYFIKSSSSILKLRQPGKRIHVWGNKVFHPFSGNRLSLRDLSALLIWVSTVRTDRFNSSAISLFRFPSTRLMMYICLHFSGNFETISLTLAYSSTASIISSRSGSETFASDLLMFLCFSFTCSCLTWFRQRFFTAL